MWIFGLLGKNPFFDPPQPAIFYHISLVVGGPIEKSIKITPRSVYMTPPIFGVGDSEKSIKNRFKPDPEVKTLRIKSYRVILVHFGIFGLPRGFLTDPTGLEKNRNFFPTGHFLTFFDVTNPKKDSKHSLGKPTCPKNWFP